MKILRNNYESQVKDWLLECACTACESKLELEASDLSKPTTEENGRTYAHYTCGACGSKVFLFNVQDFSPAILLWLRNNGK